MYGHFIVYITLIMILVKSNINKLLIIIIIIIIKEFSLSSTSPETEMINLRYALKVNKVNVTSLYLKCLRVFYVNYILTLQ